MIDLRCGDCLTEMATLADNSVDAVVTDPPYGLSNHKPDDVVECLRAWLAGEEYKHGGKGFMGKTWDSWVPGPEVWRECYRVMKPGAYLLCFAGTRTDDLMSMAIRLAGFRKHPFITWAFGSGFPKASNLSKAFDKAAGAEREVVGRKPIAYPDSDCWSIPNKNIPPSATMFDGGKRDIQDGMVSITAPVTDAAHEWDGWYYGLQSLKPAIEPVLMFQKPHEGRMTDNVLRWGTGALNIDASRIEAGKEYQEAGFGPRYGETSMPNMGGHQTRPWVQNAIDQCKPVKDSQPHAQGRWPSNLITDGSPEVVAMFPQAKSSGVYSGNGKKKERQGIISFKPQPEGADRPTVMYDDTGSAARFFAVCPLDQDDYPPLFYCAKASKADRNAGLEDMPERTGDYSLRNGICKNCGKVWIDGKRKGQCCSNPDRTGQTTISARNFHPTCKPTSLMRYLITLCTRAGATILDPFVGSGSTGVAAIQLGRSFIGIDNEPEYIKIARARCEWARRGIEDAKAMGSQLTLPHTEAENGN